MNAEYLHHLGERIQPPVIRVARPSDIDKLAYLQWHARLKAVADGYLPKTDLLLNINETIDNISEEEGIKRARANLQFNFLMYGYQNMDDYAYGNYILCAEKNNRLVGKVHLDVNTRYNAATISSLEVLPEYQKQKIATYMQLESVKLVRNRFPTVGVVKLGRYKISTEYALTNYSEDSLFNRLNQVAEKNVSFFSDGNNAQMLYIDINNFEEELKRRI